MWNIQQKFLDISVGRSWQNFSKSEQEKLSGKLDSAIFLISDYHRAMFSLGFADALG